MLEKKGWGHPAGARRCIAVFSASCSSFHSVLRAHLRKHLHFTDEKMEAQWNKRTCLRSPGKKGMEFAGRQHVRDPLHGPPWGEGVRMVVAGWESAQPWYGGSILLLSILTKDSFFFFFNNNSLSAVAESLHCSLETITTLLIGYTPTQNVFGVLKKNFFSN